MTAKTLMNPNPMTLSPSDSVAVAADRILEHHLRHLPVVDAQGRYLGTFSIYSVLKLTLPKAVLDKHGLAIPWLLLPNTLAIWRSVLAGVATSRCTNWLNIHDVAHPETPAMEIMLLMLHGRTTSVPVVNKENGTAGRHCFVLGRAGKTDRRRAQ
jgi:CBS domain-containing protein